MYFMFTQPMKRNTECCHLYQRCIFVWCVNGAWAYLSCVFYVVVDVHYSHKGLSHCYNCWISELQHYFFRRFWVGDYFPIGGKKNTKNISQATRRRTFACLRDCWWYPPPQGFSLVLVFEIFNKASVMILTYSFTRLSHTCWSSFHFSYLNVARLFSEAAT